MKRFAVIDTETTWSDKVMSIGVVVADRDTKDAVDAKYYILDPEFKSGGMYSSALHMTGIDETITGSREVVLSEIKDWMKSLGVGEILAYNAKFDRGHLPELAGFAWCDIMKLAAYRQHNPFIPENIECCATGRMKRGYGVEPMLQMLGDDKQYVETHNAYFDAIDELKIVKLLGHSLDTYVKYAAI